jgi:hypothetical protein
MNHTFGHPFFDLEVGCGFRWLNRRGGRPFMNHTVGHPFSTWMLVVEFNGLNYRGGRLFIDSGARCEFLQTHLPCWTYLCTNPDVGCGFKRPKLPWWTSLYSLGHWMWISTA